MCGHSRQCAATNYEEASLTQEDEGDIFRRNVANHLPATQRHAD